MYWSITLNWIIDIPEARREEEKEKWWGVGEGEGKGMLFNHLSRNSHLFFVKEAWHFPLRKYNVLCTWDVLRGCSCSYMSPFHRILLIYTLLPWAIRIYCLHRYAWFSGPWELFGNVNIAFSCIYTLSFKESLCSTSASIAYLSVYFRVLSKGGINQTKTNCTYFPRIIHLEYI